MMKSRVEVDDGVAVAGEPWPAPDPEESDPISASVAAAVLADLWPTMVRWLDYVAEVARCQRYDAATGELLAADYWRQQGVLDQIDGGVHAREKLDGGRA